MIQSDADNTMYKGNLLVSLGWQYLNYLSKENKILWIKTLIKLPFYYFVYLITQDIKKAYIPFKGCPVNLILKTKKKIKKSWLRKVGGSRVVIITRQDKNILDLFLKNKIKNYKIIGNETEIINGKLTGKVIKKVTNKNKINFIDKNVGYIGDFKEYLKYRRKVKFA